MGEWEKMTVAIKVCSQMDPDNIMEFLAEAKLMMYVFPLKISEFPVTLP